MSLTSPLGLMRHVHKPDVRLAVVPWLNVLLVAFMLSLLQSNFIYAPGLAIAVTQRERDAKANLPANANLTGGPGSSLSGQHIDARLAISPPSFILDNSIIILSGDNDPSLANALKESYRNLHRHVEKPVLLIMAPANLTAGTLMKVFTLAGTAGFEVQLAASPDFAGSDSTPAAASLPGSAAKMPAN